MKVTVQIVTQTDDGQDMTKEIAWVERAELTPATFGVSLAEGKPILEAIQEVVVAWQMHADMGVRLILTNFQRHFSEY